jgi:hypothetical protein
MDEEVVYSIAKYLTKLENLQASIYIPVNTVDTGLPEAMVTMIAKRLSWLTTFYVCKSVYYLDNYVKNEKCS